MILWSIIEIFLILISGFLISMELINGSIEIRFWIVFILVVAIILIPIFTIGAYIQSIKFYKEFTHLNYVIENIDPYYEMYYYGSVLNYNERLYQYRDKIQKLKIFSPYTKKIQNLEPIQMKNFDVNLGRLK